MEFSRRFGKALTRQVDESTRIYRAQDKLDKKVVHYEDTSGKASKVELNITHMQGRGEHFAPKTVRVNFHQM